MPSSGRHRVDAVLTGEIPAGEQELEGLPAAEADNRRARHVARPAGVAVRQQLPVLVDRVDAVLTGEIPAGEQELEGLPAAEADNRRARHVARPAGVAVRQQ